MLLASNKHKEITKTERHNRKYNKQKRTAGKNKDQLLEGFSTYLQQAELLAGIVNVNL
jgi:hypothetical protein